jgi:hypothetical protein
MIWILATVGAWALYMRAEAIDQVLMAIGFLVITSILLVIAFARIGGSVRGSTLLDKEEKSVN